MRKKHKNISTETFDDFLDEQGLRAETEAVAIKRVLAWQIEEAMKMFGCMEFWDFRCGFACFTAASMPP